MINFSWEAPIIPGLSIAGIELGASLEDFKFLLSSFCLDSEEGLYRLPGAPLLSLKIVEGGGRVYFVFSVAELELTGWFSQFPDSNKILSETRALVVAFLDEKVFNVSVWMFDYFDSLGDQKLANSYQGCLAEGIKLGSRMSYAASYFELGFDEGDEWFYAKNGGVIFGGSGGVDLDESVDQVIHMIMIV